MNSQLIIDLTSIDDKLCDAFKSSGLLNAEDILRVLSAIEETGISALTAVTRLGFCGEEMAYEIMSTVIDWPLVRNNAECPQSSDVIASAEQLELSIDWCIDQHIFPIMRDKDLAIYTDDPLARFPLSIICLFYTSDAADE